MLNVVKTINLTPDGRYRIVITQILKMHAGTLERIIAAITEYFKKNIKDFSNYNKFTIILSVGMSGVLGELNTEELETIGPHVYLYPKGIADRMGFDPNDIKKNTQSVLHHELTHVGQFTFKRNNEFRKSINLLAGARKRRLSLQFTRIDSDVEISKLFPCMDVELRNVAYTSYVEGIAYFSTRTHSYSRAVLNHFHDSALLLIKNFLDNRGGKALLLRNSDFMYMMENFRKYSVEEAIWILEQELNKMGGEVVYDVFSKVGETMALTIMHVFKDFTIQKLIGLKYAGFIEKYEEACAVIGITPLFTLGSNKGIIDFQRARINQKKIFALVSRHYKNMKSETSFVRKEIIDETFDAGNHLIRCYDVLVHNMVSTIYYNKAISAGMRKAQGRKSENDMKRINASTMEALQVLNSKKVWLMGSYDRINERSFNKLILETIKFVLVNYEKLERKFYVMLKKYQQFATEKNVTITYNEILAQRLEESKEKLRKIKIIESNIKTGKLQTALRRIDKLKML